MERHQQNAMAVAGFLEKHPKVAWVSYLGLPSHTYHETAKILLKGFGSTLAFGVKGGRGVDVMKALKLHSAVPNAGSVHSLVSTT
jgi:O-acetylhomoserine/O-acetylserine sulfhydrylase-like pyridoxal-dependent enzyme